MRIPRIYQNMPLQVGQSVALDEQASNHLGRVLRMKVGFKLVVFNGDSGDYHATIKSVERKEVVIQIESFESKSVESPLQTHLGIVISKGDRLDYAIQKATEAGITQITLLTSERCDVKVDEAKLPKKLHSWQRIAESACEQSGRVVVPQVTGLQSVEQWVSQVTAEKKFVLHHRTDQHLSPEQKPVSVALLVGPEGGLTAAEIELAQGQGFQALSLGPRVLRTETAPVAALSLMQWLWGDGA